jgi:hypothetical protein
VALTLVLFALTLCVAALAIVLSTDDILLSRKAKRSAQELFLGTLDDKQRESWRRNRRFDVIGASGQSYTISPYQAFNIACCGELFCVRVDGEIPVFDKLLAQRLLIEADERLFLMLANTRSHRPTMKRALRGERSCSEQAS